MAASGVPMEVYHMVAVAARAQCWRSNMVHPPPIMTAATTVVINKDNNSGSLAASRRRRSSTTIKGNGVEFQIPTFYTTIDYGISSCSY